MMIDVAHRSDHFPAGFYKGQVDVLTAERAAGFAAGFRSTAQWAHSTPQDRMLALARAAYWQSIADALGQRS